MTFLTEEYRDRVNVVAAQYVEPIAEFTTRLTEVPAPTGDEQERAALLASLLTTESYGSVAVDELGDVTGRISGVDSSKAVLIAAHIDTVFPRGVDVSVTRDGSRLHAPGVGDNTISVAAVVLLKRLLGELGVTPEVDILVTGNVGEEGLGDLRGMRTVMDRHPELGATIALEGHSLGSVTHVGVGSRRLEVIVRGPGGHSWGAYGRPSAIHSAANIVCKIDQLELRAEPKTTLNVGILEGGISVNTIAPQARLVIDMRSIEQETLESLVGDVEAIIAGAETSDIDVSVEIVGDRPAGRLPHDSGVAAVASKALTLLGIDPNFHASSTDANIPISRGLPSACIGLATGGNVHRDDEYIDLDLAAAGLTQLVMVTLETARLLKAGMI